MSALRRLGLEAFAVGGRDGEDDGRSSAQAQTEQSFGFKWARRDTYESPAVAAMTERWLIERYVGGDPGRLDEMLAGGRKIIVDAGCGAGHSALLFFGPRLHEHDYLGIDISDAVGVARARFAERGVPGDFLRSDLLTAPLPDASIDMIFSEGVLHHTDSTEGALKALAPKLVPGGRFLFYVYAKKSPVREFTDDHVRARLAGHSDEEAWRALEPLTKLGVALGELNVEVDVPEAVPLLGIPAGRIDLQRLVYWHVCKLYYRPDWTLDEMNHVNFDWFRPLNCHRQTPDEVRRWCSEAGLVVEHMDVQEAGITVVARRA